MFNAENSKLKPNILTRTAEEDEEDNKQRSGTLKDRTNCRGRRGRGWTNMEETKKQSERLQIAKSTTVELSAAESAMQKQNSPVSCAKQANLIIQFDSKEYMSEEDQKQIDKSSSNIGSILQQKGEESAKCNQNQLLSIPKKNNFLLMLNSQEKISQQSQSQLQLPENNVSPSHKKNTQPISPKATRKQFLLQFQLDQDLQSQRQSQSNDCPGQLPAVKYKTVIRLSDLVGTLKKHYYSQPIPVGAVFECVMKRDRSDTNIRYNLYDSLSLRNFMTIIKDEDGYLIIAKEEGYLCGRPGETGRELVVGRMVSNFFGTQFNCMVQDKSYRRGRKYPVDYKSQRAITIEYETNFFGLKGPRKFTAYIPQGSECKYNKSLNEVYQKVGGKGVLKFKNKTPKWNKEVSAYVLNFGGRATVSSIKNFIMTEDGDIQRGSNNVLFGKFGKELFNLDVRYPFSLLQGLSLALSSFDRKFACQ